PQSADAGRRGGAGGILGRAQRGADLGIGKVVAVAQHDGRALSGWKPAGETLELLEGCTLPLTVGPRLLDVLERDLGAAPAPQVVHRDPRRDREDPRTQVPAVLEAVVGAKRAQEGLLPRVLGPRPEQATEVAEHLVAVLAVEALERWDRHGLHHEV